MTRYLRCALLLINIFFCHQCFANSWDDFVNWITSNQSGTKQFGDSNNPGINGGAIEYNYPGAQPAWNRQIAADGSCLNQYSLNDYGNNAGFYDHTCAQDNPHNTYQNPRVLINNVSCWFGGCWKTSFSLNGVVGECNFVPTQNVVIAKRICARIASPSGDGQSSDDGYTAGSYPQTSAISAGGVLNSNQPLYYTSMTGKKTSVGDTANFSGTTIGQHLDVYGVTQWDQLVTADQDSSPFALLVPKMCVYHDPWSLDTWTVFEGMLPDIFDLDPMHQPFHMSQGDISPVAKIIIFILQSIENLTLKNVDLVGMIVSSIGASMDANFGAGLSAIFQVISQIIEMAADLIIKELTAIGQINRVVVHNNSSSINPDNGAQSGNYGCVSLPLGPYPPPYCNTSCDSNGSCSNSLIAKVLPAIFSICSTDGQGNFLHNHYASSSLQASNNPVCVLSNVDNNFIYNSVRIAYTNVIPLCLAQSANAQVNCFSFSPSSPLRALSAQALTNALVKQNNFIAPSDCLLPSNPVTPVVNSQNNYRALYAKQTFSSSGQNTLIAIDQYYYDNLQDCSQMKGALPGFVSNICQSFYGIDVGDFSDNAIIDYRQSAANENSLVKSSPVALSYRVPAGVSSVGNNFYASIDAANLPGHISVYQQSSNGADQVIDTLQAVAMPAYSDNCDIYGNCNTYNCDDYGNCQTQTKYCCDQNNNCNSYACDGKGNCKTLINGSSSCSNYTTAVFNVNYTAGLNAWPCQSSYPAQAHVAPCLEVVARAAGQNGAIYTASSQINLTPFAISPNPPQPYAMLLGKKFSVYATGANNQMPPFVAAPPVSNPFVINNNVANNSILGQYKKNVLDPASCDWDTCAVYLDGLEVISGS
jgi:hypothetical protein